MEIVDLDGKSLATDTTPAPSLKLYGLDNEVFKTARKEINDDETGLKILAVAIAGWSNILDDNNQPVEFSKASALKLLSDYPVIASQVDRFISNRKNYLKKH